VRRCRTELSPFVRLSHISGRPTCPIGPAPSVNGALLRCRRVVSRGESGLGRPETIARPHGWFPHPPTSKAVQLVVRSPPSAGADGRRRDAQPPLSGRGRATGHRRLPERT
jgi:hypothetical protein